MINRKRKDVFSPSLNFRVFYKVFVQRKLGLVATYLSLTLSFLQLVIFVFQAFLSLTDAESGFLNFMNDATSYLYMVNLIQLNSSVYFVLRIVVFIGGFFYFLLFLILRWTTAHSKSIKWLEQLFGAFNSYYNELILLPTTEIVFREIFCDDDVMIPFEQECGKGKHIFILIGAVISYLFVLFMTFSTIVYSLNGIYDKKNYFSGENRLYEAILNTTKIITAMIIAIGFTSRGFLLIYLISNLVLSMILLMYYVLRYPFNKSATEYYILLWLSVYFSESLAFSAYVIIDDEALTAGYIFLVLMIIVVPSLYYLYTWQKHRIIHKNDISSTTEFLLNVQHLLQLKQSGIVTTSAEVQFKGIIARHMAKCVVKKCFCKETLLFDPKKNRYVEIEQWQFNKSLMLKYYVRNMFEETVKMNPMDPDLLIGYAEFLFEKFRNTHLSLYQIMKVAQSNKFLHPYHRFKIFKLKQKISEYINEKNLEALDKALEIESVIFVEEQLNKVINGMKEIVTNSLNFWSYLVNRDLDLDKLSELAQKMHNSVEFTDTLWIPLKKYLRKQKKLMYFYNWFLKDFLHKRIILSEEEIDELFDNETFSVYSNDFLHVLRDDHVIFQEDSAIIHMSGNYNDLGRIIKTNRTATKLFKYTKEELEKSYVNILMPKLISDRHNSYLESYIHTGKSQLLYNQRKTFAKDREGFIMPIWIVVKQLDNPDGLVQYVGMLRPLSQKKDEQSYYILMNNFGEISGISRNLTEHLKLPGDIFQKKVINAVLLAPKLIKYLYFAKLLQDEREKRVTDSEEIDNMLIRREAEPPKKETKLSQLIRKNDKSPFMTSINKVSTLKEFVDLDNLKIDGVLSTKVEMGEKSPPADEVPMTERNLANEYENKEIEFTLRLPQKLNKFLKEFQALKTKKHELLNNQQMLVNAVESKDLLKEALKRSESGSGAKALPFLFKKKAAFHLTSYKHAMDSYVEALRTVSQYIARSKTNNVYRVKGTIVTDQYGPEKDIIKYIKITEIVKKVEKFSNYQLFSSEKTMPVTPKDDKRESSSLTYFSSQSERMSPRKSRAHLINMKAIKPSTFKNVNKEQDDKQGDEEHANSGDENDIPKENIHGIPPPIDAQEPQESQEPQENPDEIDSPPSVPSKHQNSDKSSKKDDDDDAKSAVSKGESMKQLILNELKNNLLAPFQSIYQKEDNLQINNNFPSLNNVKWFIRILFLTVIPINIIMYFTGANVTFTQLDKSVNDIFINEDLRKDYLRAHDAMTTLLLNNNGTLDSLKATLPDKMDQLLTNSFTALNDCYQNILQGNSRNEWTSVLYEYLPRVKDITSVNYEGQFSNLVIDAENSLQKLTNSISQIILFKESDYVGSNSELDFYRANSFEKFNIFLTSVTFEVFSSLEENFNDTESLSTIILIAEGVMFFLSFFGILKLIIAVIKSLREILTTFTAIENQYLRDTQRYYYRLQDFLEASKCQYISYEMGSEAFKRSTRDISGKFGENQEIRFQKKLKNIDDKSFLKQDSVKILAYYVFFVILSCGLSVTFHIQTLTSLNALQTALTDGQTFLRLNPAYIVSLIGLKELFYNRTFYSEFNLPFMSDTLMQLENGLNRTMFKSDLEFVNFMNSFLDGSPCDTLKEKMTASQYDDCKNLGLGRLSNGLITFHNHYSNYIMDTLLMLENNRFGEVTIDIVYEFGQLIQIIDGVFMEQTLALWRSNMEDYLNLKENLLVILIVIVSVLNVLVFAGAEKVVVGTLNSKFLLYRKIFNKYMLGEALVREKKIKSRLVKLKLISK